MSDTGNWCLIESDPGVFTELMRGFSVVGLECEEVYDLSELKQVSDAHGLVFLFKWDNTTENDGTLVTGEAEKTVFFAKQVIKNACATQAILNILMNVPEKDITLGDTLTNFKNFVAEFDSSFVEKEASKEDDVYHFVGYIPINNVLYELDGLKSAPISHGTITSDKKWIEFVKPVLEKRMNRCIDGNFNLMAVVPHRLEKFQKQLTELKAKTTTPNGELVSELEKNIELEKSKAVSQKAENIRRRHNYLPFILELFKILAENGRLVELVEKAEKLSQERQARQLAAKKAAGTKA